MATDLLKTYKYGWKTSYYQNTYDMKTDEVIEVQDEPLPLGEDLEDEDCNVHLEFVRRTKEENQSRKIDKVNF